MARLPRGEGRRRYDHQYQLRMPLDLFRRIKRAAQEKEQSVNGEIVAVLSQAYPAANDPESVNEAMLDAAQAVLDDWTRTLGALGQKPEDNPRVAALVDAVAKAKRQMDHR